MSRDAYSGDDVSSVAPGDFLDQYAQHVGQFYAASALPLSDVTGVNDLTATLAPALDGDGLVMGMRLILIAPATNTGGMTVAINGGSAVDLFDAAGLAIPAGAITAGLMMMLAYDGTALRMLSPRGIDTSVLSGAWIFESSGTFTVPASLDPERRLLLRGWGSGGGGSTSGSGGGGGAGATEKIVAVGDLPSTVTITVAEAAAVGANGGNTTIGSILTAYGGQGGFGYTDPPGALGGGTSQSGVDGGFMGGGGGLGGTNATTESGGGGGGGGSGSFGARLGGNAVKGGGGGGGWGAGGVSRDGGNGGAAGVAGSAPGGGGGAGAAGGRGEAQIILL